MEIKVEMPRAQKGKFSAIKLSCKISETENKKASLNIDFNNPYFFSKDSSSVAFDFFLIASIVYGIDNLLTRNEFSVNGWTREIKVKFLVKNIVNWRASTQILTDTLNFLTGDLWDVSFEELNTKPIFLIDKKKEKQYNKSDYEFVSLLSGGLDSLVGSIDLLELVKPNKKILLVSHFDSNSAGPNKDQTTLKNYLGEKYRNKSDWIQAKIFLSHQDVHGETIKIETSYRSRSILFIALGVYLQSSLKHISNLIIPENGTISLNYPMTPSRSSSLSTRTTHPYLFSKVHELFNTLNLKSKIENPYSLQTKGEIISHCKNLPILQRIYEYSVSCSKSGRKMYWDNKVGTKHCGVCIPCIYRRSGLHKSGLDNQLYGIDILNKDNPKLHDDVLALATYLKTPLSKEQIKRGLVVNSSLDIANLDNHAELIQRSREEVKKWIKDKGNEKIKDLFNIS